MVQQFPRDFISLAKHLFIWYDQKIILYTIVTPHVQSDHIAHFI